VERTKSKPLALGGAAAIVAAIIMLLLGILVIMLLLGILGNVGIYTGSVEMMQQWHMFFSLSIGGIIAGMVEAAVITFVFVYLFGLLYNKFS
jgi:hypothetical protein